MKTPIAVIGAGVIGLTTALRLLEEGYEVMIFARDLKLSMASRAAPAIWMPYKVGPEHLVVPWGKTSLRMYDNLKGKAGVELVETVEYTKQKQLPLWLKIKGNYTELSSESFPAEFNFGYKGTTFLIESDIFLDYLIDEIAARKGVILERVFRHLTGVEPKYQIIVNCAGVFSRQLVPDTTTYPIQGHYVLTQKPKGVTKITMAHVDENNYTLIIPRSNDCWLGGTAVANEWNSFADPKVTEDILARAKVLEPALANVKVLSAAVGLRPGREGGIRLETQEIMGKRIVIHNYGHGGGGYTTAWGCADEVVRIVLGLS